MTVSVEKARKVIKNYGNCLQFAQTGKLAVTDANYRFVATSNYTWKFLVNITSNVVVNVLYKSASDNNSGMQIYLDTLGVNGVPQLRVMERKGFTSNRFPIPFKINTNHVIIVKYDGSTKTFSVYLDGNKYTTSINSMVTTDLLTATSPQILLGGSGGTNEVIIGYFDEPEMYNSLLSDDDIYSLSMGQKILATPLFKYDFLETSGTSAANSVSGGTNGVITNGTFVPSPFTLARSPIGRARLTV